MSRVDPASGGQALSSGYLAKTPATVTPGRARTTQAGHPSPSRIGATSGTPAGKLYGRIFRDIRQWHEDYRLKIRAARQDRSLAISKLRPGNAPPPPVRDAMLGMQGKSAPDEHCFQFFIGPRKSRFSARYAPRYRSQYSGLITFVAESEETIDLCEKLNEYMKTASHATITKLWRQALDRTVETWHQIEDERAEYAAAAAKLVSRESSFESPDHVAFGAAADEEFGALPQGGNILTRQFSSADGEAATHGGEHAADFGLDGGRSLSNGSLGMMDPVGGASHGGAADPMAPAPLLRGQSYDYRGVGAGEGASHGGAGGTGLFGDGAGGDGEALLRGLSTDTHLAAAGGRSATGVYREIWGRLPTSLGREPSSSEVPRNSSLESAGSSATASSGPGAPAGLVSSSMSRLQYQTPAALGADDASIGSPGHSAPLPDSATYDRSRRAWKRAQSKQLAIKRAKEAIKRELSRLMKCRDVADDDHVDDQDPDAEAGGGSKRKKKSRQRAYDLISLENPFAWEVHMHFGESTALGRQLRERASRLGLPQSTDPAVAESDPMRPHAYLRLLLMFPADFPKEPPVVRLVGPLLEEGTGGVQFGAFVSKLLYGPERKSTTVEDDVDAENVKVRGSFLHESGADPWGHDGGAGASGTPMTPGEELWGTGAGASVAAASAATAFGSGRDGSGSGSAAGGGDEDGDNLAALLGSASKKKKKKKNKKKNRRSGSIDVTKPPGGTGSPKLAASGAAAGAEAGSTADPKTPVVQGDVRSERRQREKLEFDQAMEAYRSLEHGRHDRMLVVLLRALRKQLLTTSGGGVELPAARVRVDTAAEYDPDAWAAVHRRLMKDWGGYELSTRGDFRDTVRAVSGTQARLSGMRFPPSFQGGDKLITGPGIPIEMGGGSRSLELTPLSSTGAVAIGTYAGILQPSAERGTIVIPDHLMRSMRITDGDRLSIRTVELHKVKGLRLRPSRWDWHKRIPIPQMPFLRTAMQGFSSLTRGQVITLRVTEADFEGTPRYQEALRKVGGVAEEIFLAETLDPDEPMVKLWDGFFTNVKVDFLPAADAQEALDKAKQESYEKAEAEADASGAGRGSRGPASGAGADVPPGRRSSNMPWGAVGDGDGAGAVEVAPRAVLPVDRFIAGESVSVAVQPKGSGAIGSRADAAYSGGSDDEDVVLKVSVSGGISGHVLLRCQYGVSVSDVVAALSPFVGAVADWRGMGASHDSVPDEVTAALVHQEIGSEGARSLWKGYLDTELEMLCGGDGNATLRSVLDGSSRGSLSLEIDWPAPQEDAASSNGGSMVAQDGDLKPLREYVEVLLVGLHARRTRSAAGTSTLARVLHALSRGRGETPVVAEARSVDAGAVRPSSAVHVPVPRPAPVKRNDALEDSSQCKPREHPDDEVVPRTAVYIRLPTNATAADLYAAMERTIEPAPVPSQLRVSRHLADLPGSAFEERESAVAGGSKVQVGERGFLVHDDPAKPLVSSLGGSHTTGVSATHQTSASLFLRQLQEEVNKLPGVGSTTAARLRAGSKGIYVVEQVPAPLTASKAKSQAIQKEEDTKKAVAQWTCETCTGVNRAWRDSCYICHSPRPSHTQPGDTADVVVERMARVRREHSRHDPLSMVRGRSSSRNGSASSSASQQQQYYDCVITVAVGAERMALDSHEDVPWLRWALGGGHLLPEELMQLEAAWVTKNANLAAI